MRAAGEAASGFTLVSHASAGIGGAELALVVALHDRGETAERASHWARTLFGPDPDVVAPQAARPCNPFQSNLASAASYAGFSWYLGVDAASPEAASFGDSLVQLDALAAKLDRPLVLCGRGQGGTLAIALACYDPARLAGLAVENAAPPAIAGWSLPDICMDRLPALVIDVDERRRCSAARTLAMRGAAVTWDSSKRIAAAMLLGAARTKVRDAR